MFEKINALSRRHLLQAANSTMWFTETGTTLTGNCALFHTAGRDSQRRQRSHSDANFPPLFAWPFGKFGRHRLARTTETPDIPGHTHSAHRSLRDTHSGKTPMTYSGNPSSGPAAQQKIGFDRLIRCRSRHYSSLTRDTRNCFGADDETRTHTTEVTTPSR